MGNHIKSFIQSSNSLEWMPLIEPGVNTSGICVKSLRLDSETNRSPTILLKFDPGARYPYHDHPAGEEIFVVSGSCEIEGEQLAEGDYLYTPPGYKHAVKSETGCILFFVVPEEVVILEKEIGGQNH